MYTRTRSIGFRIRSIFGAATDVMELETSFIFPDCYCGVLFYIFLNVHLRIILESDQLDAQFLIHYVYFNLLHVSSNSVLILRRTIVLTL